MAAILGAQASARPIAANNDESGRSLNAAAK